MTQVKKNPLLSAFRTPHATIPFGTFSVADIEAALQEGLRQSEQEINEITANTVSPTFRNTIAALDAAGSLLGRVSALMFNMASADTSDALDALTERMSPVLAKHDNDIFQNRALFERVKAVKDTAKGLTAEEQMLLDKTYEAFERAGATLDEAGRQRFREISEELSRLTVVFEQNLLKETNAFELHVTDEVRLAGLPDSRKQAASDEAKAQGKTGWLFTLKAPSYGPFMQYVEDRDLRRQLYAAYTMRCAQGGDHDNAEVCLRIVNLRREKAQLLGFKNFAEYVLRHRMAQNEENVRSLLDELTGKFLTPAHNEVSEVEQYARKTLCDDSFRLEPWDFSYWSQRLFKERHGFDSEMLRPYFPLPAVVGGVFSLATRLYGITFSRNQSIPVYHADVEAYDVLDADGSFLGVLYCDFFARKSKQGGAWMTNYKEQWMEGNKDSRPHVAVVTNFSSPTDSAPSLLTLGEVETFLHEFGHALHGLFAHTRFRSLSGTNVWWDFVELPSQIMENYATERDFLHTFAFHYESGQPIPDDLVEKIRRARTFNGAYACMRQVSFGLLDMALYTQIEPLSGSLAQFEESVLRDVALMPRLPHSCMAQQFGHIMSGGYAAGYYSYKWAEVLDADAFSRFLEEGIFNRRVAQSFRDNILSRGGTEPPMQLYERFRGRKPTTDALLRRTLDANWGTTPVERVGESFPSVSPSVDEKSSRSLDFDRRYLQMARIWAQNSYCQRRQVGALIVKGRMIISDGYNGTPSGFENVCEDDNNVTKPYVLHAEANAITKIARSGNNSDGATLYVTDSPCIECAKLIIQSGIRRVVYSKQYRLTDGIDLLRRAGIQVEYIPVEQ